MKEQATVLDLFAGCGGFSLGAHFAGLEVALAVDIDPVLTSSFSTNFPSVPLVHLDLSLVDPEVLRRILPNGRVSGVVGGPPCQAFSEIGRRHKADDRRDLVWHFFRIVAALRPSFFVMENVRGLAFPTNREVLENGLTLVSDRYDILGPMTLDASRHGAPTKRKRIFVVGIDREEWDLPDPAGLVAKQVDPPTVYDAIADLARAHAVMVDEAGFDWWAHGPEDALPAYARSARMAAPAGLGVGSVVGRFAGHRRTKHSADVVRRFSTVLPGQKDPVGKHVRMDWNGLCAALRAGTGSDRGSYQSVRPLHPTDDRVITVREGARLQGFPDWFVFHPTVWHSFRMIGNSVSPAVSRAVLSWIVESRARHGTCAKAAE